MAEIKDFPSNSLNDKNSDQPKERKKIEPVVKKGGVTQKKESLSRKLVNTFVSEDSKSVGEYIFYDVLVPAVKEAISDMVVGGVQMLLFGEVKGKHTTRSQGRSYVSYSSLSREKEPPRYDRHPRRDRYRFDDILIEERGEAEEVLDHMFDYISEYDECPVSVFFELVGIDAEYTDTYYGWTELGRAEVVPVRGGYILSLPRPRKLS